MDVKTFCAHLDLKAVFENELTIIIPIDNSQDKYIYDCKINGNVIIDNSELSIHNIKLYSRYNIDVKKNEYGEPKIFFDKTGLAYVEDIKGQRYFLLK